MKNQIIFFAILMALFSFSVYGQQGAIYQLDSIVDREAKIVFSYENGILQERVTYRRDFFNLDAGWYIVNKIKYEYAANGKITRQYTLIWRQGNWTFSGKKEFSYDADWKLLMESSFKRMDEDWIPVQQNQYNYNEHGQLANYSLHEWNELTGEYVPNNKEEYIYYMGKKIMTTYFSWDQLHAIWENGNTQKTHEYHSNGKLFKTSTMKRFGNDWVLFGIIEYNYDEDQRLISTNYIDLDLGDLILRDNMKQEYIYDESGNKIIENWYFWKNEENIWKPNLTFEFEYDTSISKAQLLVPSDYYWNCMLLSKTDRYYDDLEPNVCNYYYSPYSLVGIEEREGGEITVYPNPATDGVRMNIPGNLDNVVLEIFDLQGRKWMSADYSGNTIHLSLRNYPSGIYLYRLSSGSKAYSGKIVKY